jgi:hypothetical protein
MNYFVELKFKAFLTLSRTVLPSPPSCLVCKLKFNEDEVLKKTYRPLELSGIEPRSSALRLVICTYCLRGGEAVAYCKHCSEALCQNCTDVSFHLWLFGYSRLCTVSFISVFPISYEIIILLQHHRIAGMTHQHELTDDLSETREAMQEDGRCPNHGGQELTTYCETCEEKLCNLCLSTDARHAEHQLTAISVLIKELRESLAKTPSTIQLANQKLEYFIKCKKSIFVTWIILGFLTF